MRAGGDLSAGQAMSAGGDLSAGQAMPTEQVVRDKGRRQ
jgi:hypothetical protein